MSLSLPKSTIQFAVSYLKKRPIFSAGEYLKENGEQLEVANWVFPMRGTGILWVGIVETEWTHEDFPSVLVATAERNENDLFFMIYSIIVQKKRKNIQQSIEG